VTEQVARAFEEGAGKRAEASPRIQDRAAARMEKRWPRRVRRQDAAAARRQIGTPRAIETYTILTVIKRQTLARFGAQLPNHIKSLDDSSIDAVKAMVGPRSPAVEAVRLCAGDDDRRRCAWQLIGSPPVPPAATMRPCRQRLCVTVDIVLATSRPVSN
jgi:hypothetical protein